ncbi:hypothetical protein GCM10014713_44900 [Streptomyces purpureus]|uniref:Uncharacterized protein n=1 Tax=Streptomyces purpureus TaxID=1951 RepID=A0A918LSB9_9ACTN|nr:hypothetical protein GCM10014713_44900 [Streptomyces purpureus]
MTLCRGIHDALRPARPSGTSAERRVLRGRNRRYCQTSPNRTNGTPREARGPCTTSLSPSVATCLPVARLRRSRATGRMREAGAQAAAGRVAEGAPSPGPDGVAPLFRRRNMA